MINTFYQTLLDEAKKSPLLLSDLAGLESYISESYCNRSFIELLQNADDAQSTDFLITRFGDYLIVANNGRVFNASDIESLCRSASSFKVRGKSIGYRGIGFKSVVSIAQEVHLISGDYEITFSRELTRKVIPEATKVPLIRIPHPLRNSVITDILCELNQLRGNGYNTFFIFSGVDIHKIEDEYLSFQNTALLFLNYIQRVDIKLDEEIHVELDTTHITNSIKRVKINSAHNNEEWEIYSHNKCQIAFNVNLEDGLIKRIPQKDALLHAFLPTEDVSGLGVIINADFSTDPSRRHLIYDEVTNEAIKSLCKLYYDLLNDNITSENSNSYQYINALIPYYDLRLIHLTNNQFEKLFSSTLKVISNNDYNDFKLAPQWINLTDYIKIKKGDSHYYVNNMIFELTGFDTLIKYLGGSNDDIFSILESIDSSEISILGYSQITAECIRKINFNTNIPLFCKTRIILSNSNRCSLEEIESSGGNIDESFIQLLNDKGVTKADIRTCLKKLKLDNLLQQFNDTEKVIKTETPNVIQQSDVNERLTVNDRVKQLFEDSSNSITEHAGMVALRKWRSAEENVLAILNNSGFKIRDISKQNVGYDLEGLTPTGENVYIEVKSLDYMGQKFRLTNNEYAVAQYYREKYYLALIVQSQEKIEICLIKNPLKQLVLSRQCIQWVWECSEYAYNPLVFNL